MYLLSVIDNALREVNRLIASDKLDIRSVLFATSTAQKALSEIIKHREMVRENRVIVNKALLGGIKPPL